jgi:hypothetical protein
MTSPAFNREIYDRYGLLNLPRKFGFPVQISIHSLSHLISLIDQNDGKYPLYISANSNNGKFVNFGQVYFDLDGHGFYSMEDALKDERKLAEYFEEQKVDFLADMTGRGFRVLLKVTPDIMTVTEASQILKGYTKHVRDSLGLKTLDVKVAEPLRIMRPPLTTYIYQDGKTKEYIRTKRHVLPIDMETLFNSDLAELTYLSEHMQFRVMEVRYRRMDLSDIAKYKESLNYTLHNGTHSDIDFMALTDEEFLSIMREIFRNKTNLGTDDGADEELIRNLLGTHPDHTHRFLACVKFKESVFMPSFESAVSFFDRLSAMAKWDNRNLDIQNAQIRSIYNGHYGIKAEGIR